LEGLRKKILIGVELGELRWTYKISKVTGFFLIGIRKGELLEILLFKECRFSARVWEGVALWLDIQNMQPVRWGQAESKQWWFAMGDIPCSAKR
jgi:hypothetical protein